LGIVDTGAITGVNTPHTAFVMHEHAEPWWFKIIVDAFFVDSTQVQQSATADPSDALASFFGGFSMLPKVIEPQDYVGKESEFQALLRKKRVTNPNAYAVTPGFAIYADTKEDPGLKIYCSTSDINDKGIDSNNTEFTTMWVDPLVEGAVKASVQSPAENL
jgi:hypothetical protein